MRLRAKFLSASTPNVEVLNVPDLLQVVNLQL